jgi:hypothetical protein
VLIAESPESCHLTSQFNHNRINHGILPPNEVSKVGSILRSFGSEVYCHTSSHAGAGKSFDIRVRASSSNLLYCHVPINSPITPIHTIIHRLEENIHRSRSSSDGMVLDDQASQNILIPIDIASTVGFSLISSLFSLCVTGVLADTLSDLVYYYHPSKVVICIELAAGMQTGSFSQLELYSCINNAVSASSFVVSEDVLRRGMGHEFEAVLFEGKATESSSSASRSSLAAAASNGKTNAFHRLAYVLRALLILHSNNGSFPVFDSAVLEDTDSLFFDTRDSLEILISYSGLKSNPSLWCMWSFVNVLFWQFQQIQNVVSPVYLACLPDPGLRLMTPAFDEKMKARIKGEMINFLIKTSREFATRQNVDDSFDPDRIVGIIAKKFLSIQETKTPFLSNINNVFWIREGFDNDGYPVFRSPLYKRGNVGTVAFYIYYRESENRWVMDGTFLYSFCSLIG